MKRFPWGRVVERFEYDFDGEIMDVVKYHPFKRDGSTVLRKIDEEKISYSCEEISQSSVSLEHLVIAWIAYKSLGLNQHALVSGIARALELH